MGKRSRQSNAEWLIKSLARLPWWACLLVGVLGYMLCSSLAQSPGTGIKTGNVAQGIIAAWIYGVAYAGTYVIPVIAVAAAIISFFGKRADKALLESVKAAPTQQTLHGLSWKQFERLVAQAFEQRGYGVTNLANGGPDGGVDIELKKDKERFLVQCKQWRATKVGVSVVRELFGVMVARGATGAFVVTSGTFTDDAAQFAQGRNIQLINGAALLSELNGKHRPPGVQVGANPGAGSEICPTCGSAMVRRVAKRGANAGAAFFGCTRYPDCHGTRPIT